MAMTIIGSPATLAAAHNDMMYVVDSTNKAQANFKYILDVYIGSTKVGTLKNRPNPAYQNYGVFNINKILQAYLTSRYFIPAGLTASVITGHKVSYVVKLSESYGSTTNIDVVTDSTRVAHNAAAAFLDHVAGVTYTDKFLTNRPRNVAIPIDLYENFYLTVMPATATSITLTSPSAPTATITLSGDSIVNMKPYLYGITGDFTATLKYGGTTLDTLNFTYGVCTPYDNIPLHFLNRRGGYETIYFRLVSKKSIKIDKKMLQEQGYVVGVGGLSYKDANNVLYDTQRPYAATYKEQMNLTCEAMGDEENEWVEELLTSTSVLTEVGNMYVPVMVKEDSYEAKKRFTDGVTNVAISIEFGQMNNSQYR